MLDRWRNRENTITLTKKPSRHCRFSSQANTEGVHTSTFFFSILFRLSKPHENVANSYRKQFKVIKVLRVAFTLEWTKPISEMKLWNQHCQVSLLFPWINWTHGLAAINNFYIWILMFCYCQWCWEFIDDGTHLSSNS